jgi:xyloglucan-specific exo-beta-1,4-glucanase
MASHLEERLLNRLARLLALLTLGCALPASAMEPTSAPYVWRNAVVGAGGFAPNILFSPVEKGLAYLRTDMGGAYRWDARRQCWIPLEDALAEGSYMGVESLAPDPLDPNVVYLAAGMYFRDPAAILRSADRGRTWAITPVPFAMGGNEDGRGLGERLAIDPDRTSTLLFGSRHDGLQRSDDSGRTWHPVATFPWRGLGRPAPRTTHAGISFVLFDASSGRTGGGSSVIYAAVADPTRTHLFRSNDGGGTWNAIAGGPAPEMLPVKGALDDRGVLYLDYSTGIGPNGIAGGAVWKLDTRTGAWTDITPARGAQAEGGYMGLSLDRNRPMRLAVSTVDRWDHGDTIWLSNDGGGHWTSLRERSRSDVTPSPFLKFGRAEADFGHWMAGLAFDPFDGSTLTYTTGATVYRSSDALRERLQWTPWVTGIEQTAIITLTSPTGGSPLISGFGDIGGFVHERLDRSPSTAFVNPRLPNTNALDYAGAAPNVVVRTGSVQNREQNADVTLAWSTDGGRNWKPLRVPPIAVGRAPPRRYDLRGEAPIVVSADGRNFVVSTPVVMVTGDRGSTWRAAAGLPIGARVIADKTDPRLFFAADYAASALFVSRDGARSFARAAAMGLPNDWSSAGPPSRESPSAFLATPGTPGELWLLVGGRLYRSRDSGRRFAAASGDDIRIELFGLGKPAPAAAAPALYASGTKGGLRAIWRSTDGGASWGRINDDSHQWGLRVRVISGDPRRFGRVYVGTDGRGILYGDPSEMRPLR